MNNLIFTFSGNYKFLSNFYEHKEIEFEKLKSTNVEKLYQVGKATTSEDIWYIMNSDTPNQAKVRGRIIECKKDWEKIKDDRMFKLLEIKFAIPELQQMLIDTENKILIEGNFWRDAYWGVYHGKGLNKLGEMLMIVRSTFTNSIPTFDKEEIYGKIHI